MCASGASRSTTITRGAGHEPRDAEGRLCRSLCVGAGWRAAGLYALWRAAFGADGPAGLRHRQSGAGQRSRRSGDRDFLRRADAGLYRGRGGFRRGRGRLSDHAGGRDRAGLAGGGDRGRPAAGHPPRPLGGVDEPGLRRTAGGARLAGQRGHACPVGFRRRAAGNRPAAGGRGRPHPAGARPAAAGAGAVHRAGACGDGTAGPFLRRGGARGVPGRRLVAEQCL